MTGFLTLEDVNGVLYNHGAVVTYHEVDTSKISTLVDFTDIKYDFVKVSKTTNNGVNTFTFEVHNSNWTGNVYCLDSNEDWFDSDVTYSNGVVTVPTESESVIIGFECCGLPTSFNFAQIGNKLLDSNVVYVSQSELRRPKQFKVYDLLDKRERYDPYTFNNTGVVRNGGFWFLVLMNKLDLRFSIPYTATVGKVNTLYMSLDIDEEIIGSSLNDLNIQVQYNDTVVDVTREGQLFSFPLDLTDKTVSGKVKLTVLVGGNQYYNQTSQEITVVTDYETINNSADLETALGDNGVNIIKLGSNFSMDNDIHITHNTRIIGDRKGLDLANHSLILDEGVKVIIEGRLVLQNGNPCFHQNRNSSLTVSNVRFETCDSPVGLGSVVSCDIDLDSLDITDDFYTELTNCTFLSNKGCSILHGGELIVDNCKMLHGSYILLNKHYPAFLYQVDGECSIKNSVFDIDYDDDRLCSNNETIGFAQCLIECGETAIVNGANYSDLSRDNSLPFFDSQYNNRSHVFAKYYHTEAETCVFTSPKPNYEDKCVCYCVSGVDWVFKQGVQVTRADSNNENTNMSIVW